MTFRTYLLFLFLFPLALISCSTGDSEDDGSVEGEISSELEEVGPLEGDGEPVTLDGAPDANAADSTAGSDNKEDEDFFSDDANLASGSQYGSEKDLQNELGKSANPPAATTVPPPAPYTPPPVGTAPAIAGGMEPAATALPQQGNLAITSKESPVTNNGFEVVAPTIQVPNEDLGISDPLLADVDPPLPAEKVAQQIVPVTRIRTEPFVINGRTMNTVYIARQGDDPGTVSEKIFERNNLPILLQDNPSLKDGVSIGDKIYYNSPRRPDDTKEMLTYYEDKKIPPQYYITKKDDNIQKIGREVLGHDEAWKEIWATNDILQTQALLPAGLKIRYWSGNETVEPPPEMPIMAQTDIPTTSSPAETNGGSELPPEEPLTTASPEAEKLPDISSMAQTADPGLGEPVESTPMPVDIATEAPAVPATLAAQQESGSSLFTIALVALIGIAVIVLVAIQIKNRKKTNDSLPPSLEFTQV